MQIICFARRFLSVLAFVLVMPVSSNAANVIADGKEWRQVRELTGYSWNDMAGTCNTSTGVCFGALVGWTWASMSEVDSLFRSYIGNTYASSRKELNSTWAPAFVADFTATQYLCENDDVSGTCFERDVLGFTRDKYADGAGFEFRGKAPMAGIIDYDSIEARDVAFSAPFKENDFDTTWNQGWAGHFLYATVTPVPEPESYAMMVLGLGFLGWVGRRRKLAG